MKEFKEKCHQYLREKSKGDAFLKIISGVGYVYYTEAYKNYYLENSKLPSEDKDGKIVSYEWNFGDGTKSIEVNTKHVYTKSGAYIVTLKVTDNQGAKSEKSVPIIIVKEVVETKNKLPEAVINGTSVTKVNTKISFTGEKSKDIDGKIISYGWSFGDGDISNGRNVSHSYKSPGIYTVVLTVADNRGGIGQNVCSVIVTNDGSLDSIDKNISLDTLYKNAYDATIITYTLKTQESINNARSIVRMLKKASDNDKNLQGQLVGTLSGMLDLLQNDIFDEFYSIIYNENRISFKENLIQEEINEVRAYINKFLGTEENIAYVPSWSSAVDKLQQKIINNGIK